MSGRWDIFCAVVDNYGDIGVCWRLARQLVGEYGCAVRLWVDDLEALCRLCPEALGKDGQCLAGVELRHWREGVLFDEPGSVVIEAFACTLPAPWLDAMARQKPAPCWINLEYLSAEDWVEGCHGLPSLQANGVRKFFYFPGFTAKTGGLLREADLLTRRAAWDEAHQAVWLRAQGVERHAKERLISLFSYEQSQLASWLSRLSQEARGTLLLVPEGKILADLAKALGVGALHAGDEHALGALRIKVLPFLRQEDYDLLLWCCDLNLVRGEDSLVRAQWAGSPFLWHIYKQQDEAHLDKLEAFFERYRLGLSEPCAQALRRLWWAWNTEQKLDEPWADYLCHEAELTEHARRWSQELSVFPDLAAGLVRFCSDWL